MEMNLDPKSYQIQPDDPRHPFYWCRREDERLVAMGLRPIFCPRCIILAPCYLHYPNELVSKIRELAK